MTSTRRTCRPRARTPRTRRTRQALRRRRRARSPRRSRRSPGYIRMYIIKFFFEVDLRATNRLSEPGSVAAVVDCQKTQKKYVKPRGDGVKLIAPASQAGGPGFDPRSGQTKFRAHLPHTPPPGRKDTSRVPPPKKKRGHEGMDGASRRPSTREDKKICYRKRFKALFFLFFAHSLSASWFLIWQNLPKSVPASPAGPSAQPESSPSSEERPVSTVIERSPEK